MQTTSNRLYFWMARGLLLLMLITVLGCSKEEQSLASYEGGLISQSEFLTRYQHYLAVTGMEDNLPDRKKILRSALHEELILQDWHAHNLDKSPRSKVILKRQEEQAILDNWWRLKSVSSDEPSPEALARMLVAEKSHYHLQELQFPDQFAAEQARTQWTAGDMSRATDLGFISLEDVHPRLAKMITVLEPGEVTPPIRLGEEGYRLIKLLEKKAPPFIKPDEFAAARPRLTQEWHVNRSASIVDAYTKSLVQSLQIEFNAESCAILLGLIQHLPKNEVQSSLSESPNASQELCRSTDGVWTISMISTHLDDTQPEHIEAVNDIQDLQNLVAGILVRRSLIVEATDSGIPDDPKTIDAIQARQDLWRINTWQKQFADTVTIDEGYLAEIEAADPQSMQSIPFRKVEVLVFADSKSALSSYKKLNSGTSTKTIAGRVKPPQAFPEDGQLGWVSAATLGQAAELVFEQKLSSWTKPWSYNGQSFIFRSTAEKIERVNQEQRQQELISRIRSVGAPVQLEKALSVMEKKYHAQINQERIKELPYIQPSGTINES